MYAPSSPVATYDPYRRRHRQLQRDAFHQRHGRVALPFCTTLPSGITIHRISRLWFISDNFRMARIILPTTGSKQASLCSSSSNIIMHYLTSQCSCKICHGNTTRIARVDSPLASKYDVCTTHACSPRVCIVPMPRRIQAPTGTTHSRSSAGGTCWTRSAFHCSSHASSLLWDIFRVRLLRHRELRRGTPLCLAQATLDDGRRRWALPPWSTSVGAPLGCSQGIRARWIRRPAWQHTSANAFEVATNLDRWPRVRRCSTMTFASPTSPTARERHAVAYR